MRLKNKKNTSSRIKFIIISVIVLALVAGAVVFAYSFKTTSDIEMKQKQTEKVSPEGVDYNTPTTEQQTAGSAQKAKAQEPDTPTSGQPIEVTITAANQSSGLIQVRTLIDTVSDTGVCTITLTKSGVTVTKQSGTQAGPSSSTCKGFDISTSELSAGDWNVVVSVQDGNRSGSVSKVLTVQ